MTEPENITLVYLRRIDDNVMRLREDVHDLLNAINAAIHACNRVFEGAVDRIERRSDLVETHD